MYSLGFKEQEACEGGEALVVPMQSAIAHSQPHLVAFGQLQHGVVAGRV